MDEGPLDGGPFRVSRPAERRVAGRPEPLHRRSEEPQTINEPPKPVHRATTPHHTVKTEKSFKRFVMPATVIGVVVLIIAGWFIWSNTRSSAIAIDSNKYQAVFFTNGQVYFGKLHVSNNDYMKLTDVYYLQTQTADTTDSKNPQETSNDQNNVQLIKLGGEIHGPEDEMIISKDQVLFYENLKPDGKVAQSIEKNKN